MRIILYFGKHALGIDQLRKGDYRPFGYREFLLRSINEGPGAQQEKVHSDALPASVALPHLSHRQIGLRDAQFRIEFIAAQFQIRNFGDRFGHDFSRCRRTTGHGSDDHKDG